MSDPSLPNAASVLVDSNSRATTPFYNWFRLVNKLALQAQATATAAASTVSQAVTITITGINGISVYGDQASGFQVDGSALQSSGTAIPLSIGEDEIFTVAANTQVLYHSPITLDGEIVVSGELIQVA